ncbi:MAG: hypothetical protein JNK48_24920 [Bryobacterales bacterium]|nr:hypothetical protein [Bryobacterales bacterium]
MLSRTLLVLFLSSAAFAGSITQYSDRPTFLGAVGPVTVEDFTNDGHFPITTGILNAATNLPGIGIVPGTIQPGVTYSAPVDIPAPCCQFNIDSGASYSGGFLDTLLAGARSRPITITFDGPVRAFGFNTSTLGGTSKNIVINFTSGPAFIANLNIGTGFPFFGFESDAQDIESVVLQYNSPASFGAAFDDFTFTDPGASNVPEPATFTLAGAAFAMAALLLRKTRS